MMGEHFTEGEADQPLPASYRGILNALDKCVEALTVAEDYINVLADADYRQGGFVSNLEMSIQSSITVALDASLPLIRAIRGR